MLFKKLDPEHDDLAKVAKLIYQTDLELFQFLFGKNQERARERIIRFIKAEQNSFSYQYIYLAMEAEEILGILIAYSGGEIERKNDIPLFLKTVSLPEIIKLLLSLPFLNRLLTNEIPKENFYISNLSVHEKQRGKGVGSFMLEEARELARQRKCQRLTLDVSLDNQRAKKLYERFGFKEYGKKSIWLGQEMGSYSMSYLL